MINVKNRKIYNTLIKIFPGVRTFLLCFFVSFIICQLLFGFTDHGTALAQDTKNEFQIGVANYKIMLERYSKIEDREILERVERVKKKIIRVADKRKGIDINITVLNDNELNSWAFPGGFIMITMGLISICDNDDELAVILSHEIAHEVKGHVNEPIEKKLRNQFREEHQEIPAECKGLVEAFTTEITKDKEINADEYGILYVALAGYDVNAAFSILDRILVNETTKLHPSKEIRLEKIRFRLDSIIKDLEVFNMGVRFFLHGNLGSSAETFKNFRNIFPSKEIYNNLAVVYHETALSYYQPKRMPKTIKTLQMDPETSAKKIKDRLRGDEITDYDVTTKIIEEKNKNFFNDYILKAIENYRYALEQDEEYLITYNNLGCAYDEIGNFHLAIHYLEEAVKRSNKSYKEALNNLGISYAHAKHFNDAKESFEKAIEIDKEFKEPYFNLAGVLEITGERKKSNDMYEKYQELKRLIYDSGFEKEMVKSDIKDTQVSTKCAEGIHWLSLDDKMTTVINFIGGTDKIISVLPLINLEMWVYLERGFNLLVKEDNIVGMTVQENYTGKTAKGLSIGAKETEILIHYGQPDFIRNGVKDYKGYNYEWDNGELCFITKEGRLVGWDVYEKKITL